MSPRSVSAGQLPPLPEAETATVSITAVKTLSGGLLSFTCQLADGSVHQLITSGKGATLGNVTIAADVLATLALSGKGFR